MKRKIIIMLLIGLLSLSACGGQLNETLVDIEKDEVQKGSDEGVETMVQEIYVPGVYVTPLVLNNSTVDIEVTVDENHINSVRFVNINETFTSMFPQVEPAFESIVDQIYEGVELSDITYDEESRYTSEVLIEAIRNCLDKASVDNGS